MDSKLGAWKLALRRWQRDAFDAWWADQPRDALIVATPGAGKTRFAARLAHAALASRKVRRVFMVVPREHLKAQTAISLAQAGLRIDHRFENASGALASDVHGAAITYQQIAAAPQLYQRLVGSVPSLVILDEIHHAGDAASWGAALKDAFARAAYRICLSGTPFRSDGSAIPYVTYHHGQCVADYSYDYADALKDGVCRPLVFPLQGGYAEWVSKDGELHQASFDQALRKSRMSERLRTVLVQEAWIGDVIAKANAQLLDLRRGDHPNAAALAIAMNQDHARFLAGLVEARTGAKPTIVLSDEDGASRKIAAFARSDDPWIVAVHMVSEGVDIPRLRVGLYASNVVTEMYFRQFCGRFVRAQRGGSKMQHAYVYLPDDQRLRELATRMTTDVRGVLHVKREFDELEAAQRVRTEPSAVDNHFEAISANVDGERVLDFGPLFNPDAYLAADDHATRHEIPHVHGPDAELEEEHEPEPEIVLSVAEEKEQLRRSLAGLVAQVSQRFRVEHRKIHATLNQRYGGPIAHATVDSLRRRRAAALSWLDKNRYDGLN